MDFNTLLAEHAGGPPTSGTNAADSVLGGLDGALKTPRDGDSYRARRLASGGRGRRGGRERDDGWKGSTDEVEPGAFRYTRVWGDYLKWDEEVWSTEEPGNIVVQFEAKGEDNIVVALSTEPKLITPMYEIVIGGWKDTKSVIRREPQGIERALSARANICTPSTFSWYWVMQRNGVVSFGLGERPGKQVVMAWKDPEPLDVAFASFTTWDREVTFRNIYVGPVDTDMELEEVEMSTFVPEYLLKLEEERAAMRERAKRFGNDYVEPSAKDLAERVLDPAEKEKLNHRDPRKAPGNGFITGIDLASEEEQKKAEERAKRFGTANVPDDANDEDMMSRERREARAKRFGVPIIEDEQLGKGLMRDLTALRVPRRDPAPEDLPRSEVLHIYGSFDQMYTKDLQEWFQEYGISSVEWLHDCAANLVFADQFTAKRALAGLCMKIPPIEGFEAEVEFITNKGYQCAPFPFTDGSHRYFLVRQAAVSDVKAVEPEYRTKLGFNPKKEYKGASTYKARKAAQQIMSKAVAAAQESIVGKSRKRDDDDEDMGDNAIQDKPMDDEGEDEGTTKRRKTKLDDDVEK